MDIRKLQSAIIDGLEDVKAQDIVVFNTEHLSALFERVIIATGTSNRQTKSLASSVRTSVKEAGYPVPRVEGESNGEWIIVDCGAAVVHIMQAAIRQYYNLEEIWGGKPVAFTPKARKGPVTASEPMDEAPVKPKKAAGKTTPARKTATTAPVAKKVAAKKSVAKKTAAGKPVDTEKVPARKVTVKKASTQASARATTVGKKTAAKPVAAKKAAIRTVAVKKVAAKKVAGKTATKVTKIVVNAPEKKTAAKKAPARKVAVQQVAAKKVAVKKVAVKKVAAKKAVIKKSAR